MCQQDIYQHKSAGHMSAGHMYISGPRPRIHLLEQDVSNNTVIASQHSTSLASQLYNLHESARVSVSQHSASLACISALRTSCALQLITTHVDTTFQKNHVDTKFQNMFLNKISLGTRPGSAIRREQAAKRARQWWSQPSAAEPAASSSCSSGWRGGWSGGKWARGAGRGCASR